MNKLIIIFVVFGISNFVSGQTINVFKPSGCFSSSGGNQMDVINHPECRGALVVTHWKSIEPSQGKFDFTIIKNAVKVIKTYGKKWSLAVASGGTGSPTWLFDSLHVPYVNYSFRGVAGYKLPLFWDSTVQHRLTILAEALGKEFADETSLALVYVTQITANGNEGHLNGINMDSMRLAGFTSEKWIASVKYIAKAYANAFPNKALAVEVHEIDNSAEIPKNITNDLWDDASLQHRVGAAMWWLSGKTSYQPALIQVLKDFPGDKYAQVIGRSDETSRFQNNDYKTIFSQAKEIGLRYIEPWEWEYKNHTFDNELKDFNHWADDRFLLTSVEKQNSLPENFLLYQNYPNPFNPETNIQYQLSSSCYVSLKVYDLLGREIEILIDSYQSAGKYLANFNGSKLSSGTYFYTLKAGNYAETKKMILIR